eukprot:897985-Amphidinium_carterae.1
MSGMSLLTGGLLWTKGLSFAKGKPSHKWFKGFVSSIKFNMENISYKMPGVFGSGCAQLPCFV